MEGKRADISAIRCRTIGLISYQQYYELIVVKCVGQRHSELTGIVMFGLLYN